MVNLEKISDLLQKGVENPAFQNDEENFSAKKWKKEVKEYTEPFLNVITERVNESLSQENDPWGEGENEFKTITKSQGKQKVVLSLQDAKCKLGEPFALTIGGSSRRPFEAVILLAPSESCIEKKYGNCVLWGLRWWGKTEDAKTVHDCFRSINQDASLTALLAKDKALGGSYAWLFNSVTPKGLTEAGLESIVDRITEDFLKLSTILSKNKELFPLGNDNPPTKYKLPKKVDVEKAVLGIWSKTGKTKINKSHVLKRIESDLKEKRVKLKPGWRKVVEKKLEDWF